MTLATAPARTRRDAGGGRSRDAVALLPEPGARTDGLPAPVRGWWVTHPVVIVPVVAAVLVGVVAMVLSRGTSGPGVGEAIVSVDGSARVERRDGSVETITGRVRLGPGDRIDIRRGTAAFELADDVRYEGRGIATGTGNAGRATSVRMARIPVLEGGPLLVRAPRGAQVRAGSAEVEVGVGGVSRLSRSYAVRVAVYRGSAVLSSAGRTRTVPGLRAAEAAGAGEVGRPGPVSADRADAWDRRYLADAIALDRQLGPLAAGLRSTVIDPQAFLDAVRVELASPPSAAVLRGRTRSRTLRLDVGIALAVIGNGTRGTFTQRWDRGTAFHDAGASWGLVAMDLRSDPDAASADLRDALDRDALASSLDASTGTEPGPTDPVGSGTGSGTGTGTTTPTVGAGTGTTTPTVGAGEAPVPGDPGTVPEGPPVGPGGAGPEGAEGPGGTGPDGSDPAGPGTGSTGPVGTAPSGTAPGGTGGTGPGGTVPGGTGGTGGTGPGGTVPGTGGAGGTGGTASGDPGVTVPGGGPTVTVPPVTAPALPAVPVVPRVIPELGHTVGSVVEPIIPTVTAALPIVTGLLPIPTTTRPRAPAPTTTTQPLIGLVPPLGL